MPIDQRLKQLNIDFSEILCAALVSLVTNAVSAKNVYIDIRSIFFSMTTTFKHAGTVLNATYLINILITLHLNYLFSLHN